MSKSLFERTILKVLMYKFHYDYIKNKYGNNSKRLFPDTGSLMYELKLVISMKILIAIKRCLDLVIVQLKSKHYDDSSKLVIGKMKDERAGVAIEKFIRLKPKMYSNLVDDNSEHRKAKGVNRNTVATISHNKYKDVLLNKKLLRHSINRI